MVLNEFEKRILREVLDDNQRTYEGWLKMINSTEAEKEVARMRIMVGHELRRKLLGE